MIKADTLLSVPVRRGGHWGFFVVRINHPDAPIFRWPTKRQALAGRDEEKARLEAKDYTVRLEGAI